MKRFIVWLLPIIVLLIGIPLLLIYNVSSLAKVSGVVVVVLTTLAIRYWMFKSKNQKIYGERIKLTINERFFLKEHLPYYNKMSVSVRKQFEEKVSRILSEVSFDNYDHTEAGKEACLSFASVVTLVNSHSDITSLKDVIVVFWDRKEAESGVQGSNRVIFISENVLKAYLKEYFSPGSAPHLSPEYQSLLVKQA